MEVRRLAKYNPGFFSGHDCIPDFIPSIWFLAFKRDMASRPRDEYEFVANFNTNRIGSTFSGDKEKREEIRDFRITFSFAVYLSSFMGDSINWIITHANWNDFGGYRLVGWI